MTRDATLELAEILWADYQGMDESCNIKIAERGVVVAEVVMQQKRAADGKREDLEKRLQERMQDLEDTQTKLQRYKVCPQLGTTPISCRALPCNMRDSDLPLLVSMLQLRWQACV